MAEDLSQPPKDILQPELTDDESVPSPVVSPEERAEKDESAKLLDGLEGQLTPEDFETISSKLKELSDSDKQVYFRFINSNEYLNSYGNKDKRLIPIGIEFNIATISEIKKSLAGSSYWGWKGRWGNYAETMTSTQYGVADLMENYTVMAKRYRELVKEAKVQGHPEAGRRQFISELKQFVANFIQVYSARKLRHKYSRTDEEKVELAQKNNADIENYEYREPMLLRYGEGGERFKNEMVSEKIIDPDELAKKVSDSVAILEDTAPNGYTFTEADKEGLTNVLQKKAEDISNDDLRLLMEFLRHWQSTSEAEGGMFLPYDMMVIMDEKAIPDHRSLAGWRLSESSGDTRHILGTIALISDKRLYAKIAKAMISTEKHDFYHPILTPSGEPVFPTRSTMSKAEDAKAAETVRRQIITGEREENQAKWREEAKRLNSQRSVKDKLLKRNATTWQDVAQDVANGMNNERDA